jgi:predicted DNA-binding transcriptional regulator YafY
MGTRMHDNGRSQATSIDAGRHPRGNHFPLTRLLQLIALLQTVRYPNARQLAETCEVSRRTIYRDLATLADAGMNVIYRPDRQGYQLKRGLFLLPTRLDEREAIALLLLCRQWTAGDDLGLRQYANRAMDKVIQCLPEDPRGRIKRAADVVSEAPEPCFQADRQKLFEQILDAISRRRQIRIWVHESGSSRSEPTKFGIYRLIRMDRVWCLVGRSTRHCDVTILPICRIDRAELTEDECAIPPRFHLDRFLARQDTGESTSNKSLA